MISLLLAVISFIFTVALHIVSISLKITIKTIGVSLKVGSKIVKRGAKTSKKVVKKTVNTTKKASKKVKNTLYSDNKTAEETAKNNINTNDEDNEELFSRSKAVMKKLLSLKLIQKTIRFLLNFFRGLFVLYVVYVFVLGIFVVTGSLALISSAGYVALAYDTGNLENNSFDITQDNSQEEENSSSGVPAIADDGTIEGKLKTVAQWYMDNVKEYGSDKNKNLKTYNGDSLMKGAKCRNDCTGFAAAFASYVSGEVVATSHSGAMITHWDAEKHGWTYCETNDLNSLDDLKTGDILVARSSSKSKGGTLSSRGHHAEVYIDNKHSWGWGSVHDHYPYDCKWEFTTNSQGRKMVKDGSHDYVCFYRYTGK